MWILNVKCWSDCWMVEVSPCFTLYHAECLLLALVHSHLICTTFHNPGDTGDTDQYQELCPPTPTIIPIKHYCVALPSKLRIRIYILRGRISLYCLQTARNAAWSETISTNPNKRVLIYVTWECSMLLRGNWYWSIWRHCATRYCGLVLSFNLNCGQVNVQRKMF